MNKGSLQAFLEEIGRQTQLKFEVLPELDNCVVTAFMRNINTRQALEFTLSIKGVVYQQLGPSNFFVVAPRSGREVCPRNPPTRQAEGSCYPASGSPISLVCQDGGLSDFVDIIHLQSGANFFFWDGAEDYPISIRLKGASIKKAMQKLLKDKRLSIDEVESANGYVISQRDDA